MREILFRGFTTPKNKGHEFDSVWVEGDLITFSGRCLIHPKNNIVRVESDLGKLIIMHEVIPETVGQYTGLTDKNGKKIFEGDVVKTQPFSNRPYSKKAKFKQHIGVVENKIYRNYVSEWFVRIDDYEGFACCSWSAFYDCEVIGNIHDNPELLKGAD